MQVYITNLIDDAQCDDTVREWRWPEGRQCPFCESKRVMKRGCDDKEPARHLKPSRAGERTGDGFKSAFFDLPGGGFLELIQPTDATGPVARGLATRGEGVYLVSMAVDDLEAEVAGMRERGVRLLGDPGPGKPFTGVVFVHPRETKGVLMQLVQRK